MGNGESTSRRVSMQRSDEGTIQISENVMNRLSNIKPPKNENEVLLSPGESVIHEEELKGMLEKAFHQGQSKAISKLQAEQEKLANELRGRHEKEEVMHKQQLEQLAEYWKSEFEKETSKVKELAEQDTYTIQNLHETLTQKEQLLNEEKGKLYEEKTQLVEEKTKIVEEKSQLDVVKSILDEEKNKLNEEKNKIDEVKSLIDEEKSKLDEERSRVYEERSKVDEEKSKIDEERSKVDEEKNKVDEEKSKVDEEKLTVEQSRKMIEEVNRRHERELQAEFDRGVGNIESQIKPLQHSPICTDIQQKVLECYRNNKKQPLKCANEVQDFVQCVQAARVKLMQNKLFEHRQ